MPQKKFYTVWLKDPCYEDARLFDDLPPYVFKKNAFRKAKELSSRPEYSGCSILVRRVALNSNICVEWRFDSIINN